jgi:hypothetical protein
VMLPLQHQFVGDGHGQTGAPEITRNRRPGLARKLRVRRRDP